MYCNYSADKFNKEITFIIPSWLDLEENSYQVGYGRNHQRCYNIRNDNNLTYPSNEQEQDVLYFLEVLHSAEYRYLELIENKKTPQQAREVLPNATKTEIIVTGFASDWKHFFSLRCDKAAHPDMRALAIPLQEEFIKRGYI